MPEQSREERTRGERARALRDVIEETEWQAASSPHNGDAYYDKQEKARERLLRLGYKFEWTGPYSGKLIKLDRPKAGRKEGETWEEANRQ